MSRGILSHSLRTQTCTEVSTSGGLSTHSLHASASFSLSSFSMVRIHTRTSAAAAAAAPKKKVLSLFPPPSSSPFFLGSLFVGSLFAGTRIAVTDSPSLFLGQKVTVKREESVEERKRRNKSEKSFHYNKKWRERLSLFTNYYRTQCVVQTQCSV